MKQATYQIGEVAEISGVSIRMLRHYDKLGLLVPSSRTAAGYRHYGENDLLRLQQIVIGRALGLSLEDVRKLLDDSQLDRRALLRRQRQELVARAQSTTEMIRSVDAALVLLETTPEKDRSMNMTQLFDGFDHSKYEAEVKQRWGSTDAYRESQRRVRSYNEVDRQTMKEEYSDIMKSLSSALDAGTAADDPAVMEIAERHRLSIDRWYYPCSRSMHASLADLFEADERFAKNIDRFASGLTPFLVAAIRANLKQASEE